LPCLESTANAVMVMVEVVTESGAEAVHWQYFTAQNNAKRWWCGGDGEALVMV